MTNERSGKKARLGWAAVRLLSVTLAATAALSMLVIWHLVRRGRWIRERLGNPKPVRLDSAGGDRTSASARRELDD